MWQRVAVIGGAPAAPRPRALVLVATLARRAYARAAPPVNPAKPVAAPKQPKGASNEARGTRKAPVKAVVHDTDVSDTVVLDDEDIGETGGSVANPVWQLMSKNRLDEAEATFKKILAGGTASSEDYSAWLFVLQRRRDAAEVFRVWREEMIPKGFKLTRSIMNVMLQSSNGPGLPSVEAVWDECVAAGVTPSSYALNTYLDKKVNGLPPPPDQRVAPVHQPSTPGARFEGQPEVLFRFYMEQRVKYGPMATPRTYALLFSSMAMSQAPVRFAYDVLAQMKRDEVPLNAVHASLLLDLGLLKMSPPLVTEALQQLKQMDFKFSEGVLMELVLLYAKRGMWANVAELEHELVKRFPDTQPSEAFFRLAVHGATKMTGAGWSPPWTEIFRLLHAMDARGHNRNARLLSIRLNNLMRDTATVDDAFYALEDMFNGGHKVAAADLLLVVRGCGRVMDLDRALATFAEFPSFGLQPDVAAYTELLGVCFNIKDAGAALNVLDQMEKAGIELDHKARIVAVKALTARDYTDHALSLIEGRLREMPPTVLSQLVYIMARDNRLLEAHALSERIMAEQPTFRPPDISNFNNNTSDSWYNQSARDKQ